MITGGKTVKILFAVICICRTYPSNSVPLNYPDLKSFGIVPLSMVMSSMGSMARLICFSCFPFFEGLLFWMEFCFIIIENIYMLLEPKLPNKVYSETRSILLSKSKKQEGLCLSPLISLHSLSSIGNHYFVILSFSFHL